MKQKELRELIRKSEELDEEAERVKNNLDRLFHL